MLSAGCNECFILFITCQKLENGDNQTYNGNDQKSQQVEFVMG